MSPIAKRRQDVCLLNWTGPLTARAGQRHLRHCGLVADRQVSLPRQERRELLPIMEELGKDEEEAALTLGAGGWQILLRVTLPKVRWGLLYGVILCNARAMGEFGAVSVVSGHIRGQTNTIPLQVEILYNEYNLSGAFAVASVLTLLALVTLAGKKLIEARIRVRA